METMIAFCGIVCTECDGYKATQANDEAWLERLAERARKEFGAVNATAAGSRCDGCLSPSSRKCSYCAECAVRACGVQRQVANCAACPDYACEKLTSFLAMVPSARAVLDGLRSAPGAVAA